jgi:HK97 family phage major capsid protein
MSELALLPANRSPEPPRRDTYDRSASAVDENLARSATVNFWRSVGEKRDAHSIHFDAPVPSRANLSPLERAILGRAGIDSVTSTTGAAFAFTAGGPFRDILRSFTGAVSLATWRDRQNAGAEDVPKLTTDAAGEWTAENSGSNITVNDIAATKIQFHNRAFGVGLRMSRQIVNVAAANYDMAALLTAVLAAVCGNALRTAALTGLGSGSNQPLGLLSNTDVATMAMGTDGGPLTLTQLALMEEQIGLANADRPGAGLAWQTTPAVRRKARLTETFTGSGRPLWSDDDRMIGKAAFASTAVPSTLTKGTSSGVCSALVFGAWADLGITLFGPGITVISDPYTKKFQGMIELAVWMYADVQTLNAASFRKTLDLTT